MVFEPHRSQRAFENIAEQIKRAILSKQLNEGDRLPSERELAKVFQVGRVSIREALRTLETRGFIEIKKGNVGGAYVHISNPESISVMIMDRLELEGATHEQIVEARKALECAIVRSAIEHATPKDLEKIEGNLEESKEIHEPEFTEKIINKMIHFHLLIAEASHNLPFMMFQRSLMEWAARKLAGWVPSANDQMYSYESHVNIYEALKAQDVKLAETLMHEHVNHMGELVLSKDNLDRRKHLRD